MVKNCFSQAHITQEKMGCERGRAYGIPVRIEEVKHYMHIFTDRNGAPQVTRIAKVLKCTRYRSSFQVPL